MKISTISLHNVFLGHSQWIYKTKKKMLWDHFSQPICISKLFAIRHKGLKNRNFNTLALNFYGE